MTANLSHFALNTDDLPATRAFYEAVFGWHFTAWGPPGFYRIRTGAEDDPGVDGALQQRRAFRPDLPVFGVEATFAVDDVDATVRAVTAAGGELLMDRFTIAGVGHLVFFRDPGGNAVGAMQYDAGAG